MSFPLIANSKIKLSITNILKEKRLPHAILIEGDIGTGKHTLAFFLAKAAVCCGEDIPCNTCTACNSANHNNHPDINIIAPKKNKKNISVEQVRELRQEAFVKPHSAARRVFVIDFADTLNEASQNALLKVLEEPPQSAMFILIAESKASLLQTIISRCVVFSLTTPSKEEAFGYISNKTEYDAKEINLALENTQNNIGKALLQLKGKSDSNILNLAEQFLCFFVEKNSWGMLDIAKNAEKNRITAAQFLKDLKYCTAKKLRENLNSNIAKALSTFYSEICLLEESLNININLSLLFCALTAKAEQILNRR